MTDREYFQINFKLFYSENQIDIAVTCGNFFPFRNCPAKNSYFFFGKEGHKSYRIPAIIKLPNNDLLAFCEGRVHGSGDFGDIDIIMKRSRDHDKTEKKF